MCFYTLLLILYYHFSKGVFFFSLSFSNKAKKSHRVSNESFFCRSWSSHSFPWNLADFWGSMSDAQPIGKIVLDIFLLFKKNSFGCHFQICRARKSFRVLDYSLHFIDYGAHIDFKDWLRFSSYDSKHLLHYSWVR